MGATLDPGLARRSKSKCACASCCGSLAGRPHVAPGHPIRRCRCRGRSSALAPLQYRLRQLGIWRRRDGRGADLIAALADDLTTRILIAVGIGGLGLALAYGLSLFGLKQGLKAAPRGVKGLPLATALGSLPLCAFGRIELRFLPPYSPDLMPVERRWSWLRGASRDRLSAATPGSRQAAASSRANRTPSKLRPASRRRIG